MRHYKTIAAPRDHLCPSCLAHAESFQRCLSDFERHEQEDRLRSGEAPTSERIKAAWDLHGKGREWPEDRGYRISIPEPIYLSFHTQKEPPAEAVQFTTFDFVREVTRNPDFTVTRISCGGLTVEETVS